jgi:isoleucyl-tRNA synthetase
MISQSFSTLQEIITKESELVESIGERSKMNYRAWYHRCWLVSYMTIEQVNHSLHFLRYPDLLNIWFELVNISYGQISLTLQHFSDFIKLVTFVS